ncbi:GNAT family N-acetyltransferase [Kineosporia sp. A_224]|uniref:GNAT family N-acetyltransferase n=1 Tax=Kineosporia sp. A_224 TaxID=1962180 RepID=UPI000B4B0C13|nr:GNAT family N-acetyltransferase [Kineosporia sp. A_224]
MSTTTRRGAVTLRTLDLDDPADVVLFHRAYGEVDLVADRHLLGDRSAPRSAEDTLVSERETTSYRTTRGVALDDGGSPVGTWLVELTVHDNLDIGFVDVTVHPEHRRRGIGSILVQHTEALVRAAGRSVVQTWQGTAVDPAVEDPTTPFATRHGYTSTLPSLRNDLDLDPGPDGLARALAPLDAETAGRFDAATDRLVSADGQYRLVTWWNAVPDEYLDDRAYLIQRMSTDAPAGDMTIEEERWDGARVRENEAISQAQGKTVVETAAVHVPSGRLVAFTVLAVPKHLPDHAFQWDTLVLREHRGQRLGMAIKAANLRALAARTSGLRRVTTYNAESNAPMLRVNRAMGFRPVLRTTCWEKRTGTHAHE